MDKLLGLDDRALERQLQVDLASRLGSARSRASILRGRRPPVSSKRRPGARLRSGRREQDSRLSAGSGRAGARDFDPPRAAAGRGAAARPFAVSRGRVREQQPVVGADADGRLAPRPLCSRLSTAIQQWPPRAAVGRHSGAEALAVLPLRAATVCVLPPLGAAPLAPTPRAVPPLWAAAVGAAWKSAIGVDLLAAEPGWPCPSRTGWGLATMFARAMSVEHAQHVLLFTGKHAPPVHVG
eukprot:CAMPEP_0172158894 /NCGR_PEP_ID=MMETSP1050-20130122/4642_1 /TAXON_ID=233186 /ORGANISM="Cryptomonas curvata, Strain CCAP979/52" /LENGTH=238 /DNA_ID=CAMNT_0012828369 /DNA_START=539 /DNA_END=1252 /DNA_ORIENTATION=-